MFEASESGRRLPLQADSAESEEEPGHVGPLVHLVFQLVLGAVKGKGQSCFFFFENFIFCFNELRM